MESITPPDPPPRKPISPIKRYLLRALGVVMVGLATAGAFLPLLPTTPFLLFAWEERQAIPVPAKVASGVAMAASWCLLAATYRNIWVVAGVGVLLLAVFAYVVTRPSA